MQVAALQMTSTPDKASNLATAERLVRDSAEAGAAFVALPEMFNVLGGARVLRDGAEALDGPTITWAKEQARRHGVWLLAGTIMEHVEGQDRVYNTSCLVDPNGTLTATYRKVHLFDVDVEGAAFHESATVAPGRELVVTPAAGFRLGMSVCYDLRFPELFRILALRGAQVIALPSAFTAATGPAHWETLVRARAIENQVYFVAPNQVGASTKSLHWHGHAMVVDPWGEVLAEVSDAGEGVARAEIDMARLDEIRLRLPSLGNRRPDAYAWPESH